MSSNTPKMFQVSTLQALAKGYSKGVVTVGELLEHGDTGLGTFRNVEGEMIMVDGHCYQALDDGSIVEARPDMGVPFSSVTKLQAQKEFEISNIGSIDELKVLLDNKVEEGFGLNSMHVVRIDGHFAKVYARSVLGYEARFITLREILSEKQKEFCFEDIDGTLVCICYPDYMEGINAVGWHMHFISKDRRCGGHVFDIGLVRATVKLSKISRIEIQLPTDIEFDIYSLKNVSREEIHKIEQASSGDK
ncbi:MAG: acetolactate decarboxylase [Clostridiales bacterium]|nr:acetolactate decarboxylase [Clostridiales bacterium]